METAISELENLAGIQFDPKAVEAFLRAYEKGAIGMEGKKEK